VATRNPTLNRQIADLTARQDGLITTDQLLTRGVSGRSLEYLVSSNQWERLTPGLYQTTSQQRDVRWQLRAAQLATPGRSLIVGSGALLLYGLINDADWLLQNRKLEIGVGNRTQPSLKSIHHRLIKPLEFAKQQYIDGMFVVSPERALVDACRLMRPARAERVIEDAFRRKLTSPPALRQRLGIQTAGNPVLRMIMASYENVEKSDLEVRFVQLLRTYDVQQPQLQHEFVIKKSKKVIRVDAYWPSARLAVELDGLAYHSSARELQSDRNRQNTLLGLGVQLRRYSYSDIQERPAEVAREIHRLLQQSVA
jgi:very-short-patch-repair endonuclease